MCVKVKPARSRDDANHVGYVFLVLPEGSEAELAHMDTQEILMAVKRNLQKEKHLLT